MCLIPRFFWGFFSFELALFLNLKSKSSSLIIDHCSSSVSDSFSERQLMKLTRPMVLLALFLGFSLHCKSTRNRNFQDLEAAAEPSEREEPIGWSNSCAACLCTLATRPDSVHYKAKSAEPHAEFQEKHNWCERNWACHGSEYITFLPDLESECKKSSRLQDWEKAEGKSVCVYEHSFFGGAEQCYGPGEVIDLGEVWSDCISSIRIFGNAELEYWENPQFQGNGRKTSSQWIPRLEDPLDDQISSLRIK